MKIERMDATFEELKWDEDAVLPRDFVRAGMESGDLEVQGTLYRFLADARNAARVSPPLDHGELLAFASAYLGRCLREDPLVDDFLAQRSSARSGAAWEIVRCYVNLLKTAPLEDDAPAAMRAMLAATYLEGDANLRDALVQTTLSHLFASAAVRRTFAEWKRDPQLRAAYAAALPERSPGKGLRLARGVAQPLTKKSRTDMRT